MKYSDLDLRQIEKVVKKLGLMNGVNKFLRGELIVPEPARRLPEENGVIYFFVNSDGTTGEQWIDRLEKKNFRVGDYAKGILRSNSFEPTSGITTYEIAVLKDEMFSDNDRITKNIRKHAKNYKLTTPNAEVACLIREKFSDKELEAMGLHCIVTMHEPIKDFGGHPRILIASRDGSGSWLNASSVSPDNGWGRSMGFAFIVS